MLGTIMPSNYASNENVTLGAHTVVLLNDKVTYDDNIGKFVLPYITPNQSTTSEYLRSKPKVSTGNVINKDNLGITNITESNYIELPIPKHFFYIEKIDVEGVHETHKAIITRKEFYKGQRFVIINAGGDIECPYIIGVI